MSGNIQMVATIQILLSTENDEHAFAEVCDAIGEAMRPLLQEYGGSTFVDWRFISDPDEATEEERGLFQYQAK